MNPDISIFMFQTAPNNMDFNPSPLSLPHFSSMIGNQSDCQVIYWSPQAAKTIQPLLYLSIVAAISHCLFWIQFIAYPSVRQSSMQWLYAYLITDLLLVARFFLQYAYRYSTVCVPDPLRTILCYLEAILDNYLNLIQSYILLALNICRYLQIAHNHNVYRSNRLAIAVAHLLIYSVPLLGHVLAIVCKWSVLQNPEGDACDLLPVSLSVRLLFLLFSYFIPVILTLVFLFLCLNYIHDTDGIRTQVIVDARLKHHRQLVVQSCVFYSLWLIFWSPHLLFFPFGLHNTQPGTIGQILHCISIIVDPIIITIFDTRFLQAWKATSDHFKLYLQRNQAVRVPVILVSGPSDATIDQSSDSG